jgi:hypothetical protein
MFSLAHLDMADRNGAKMMLKRAGPMRAMLAGFAAAMLVVGPGAAQIRNVDPNSAIDADLDQPAPPPRVPAPVEDNSDLTPAEAHATPPADGAGASATAQNGATQIAAASGQTYRQDDLIGAAEGVFGRGAEGLARMIQDILREQGEPNGYIVGREVGGAFVVGLRYGSGTLHHRIEGTMPVYWTGPSVGLDAGANAGSTFVLVYNLHDSSDLYRRYAAGEGAAYLVGGFNGSYLRRGDVVLIPIRSGLGLRLGANVGYMKFSRRQRWLPF